MTRVLEATPGTTTDVFSRDTPPALTVSPGERLLVGSLDASGYLEPQRVPGEDRPRMFPAGRGHTLTGPVEVTGAVPGQVLAVRLIALRPAAWGWTVAAARDNRLTRRLGLAAARRRGCSGRSTPTAA